MPKSEIPWWSRIKVRVLLFGVVMSIVPVVLISFYYFYSTRHNLEQNVQIQNKLLAEHLVQEVDSLLRQTEDRLRNAYFPTSALLQGTGQIQLYRILAEIPMAEEAVVLDADGNVRQGVNRFKIVNDPGSLNWRTPDMLEALKTRRVYYGNVTFTGTCIPFVKIVVPYYSADGRTFVGGVGVQVRLRSLLALVSSKHIGNKEDVFLVDAQGRLIAHSDFTKVLEKTDVANLFIVRHFMENGNPEELSVPNRYLSTNGQEVLGVYSNIRRTGWAVIVEQPVAVAFASIHALVVRLAWFLVTIMSGSVLISIFFGLSFTKPLEYLQRIVRKVGGGESDTEISLGRKDELGHLASSFNDMVGQLRQQSERLLQEKERLDTIVHGIGAGLALIYRDHRVAWMNPVLENWVRPGLQRPETACYQVLAGLGAPCADCPLLNKTEMQSGEDLITVLTQNGEQRLFRHRIYRLEHVREGEPQYLLVVEDITQQRRMEEMVMQADKLSALGLMASGFAHEINNPLATIQVYAEDLEERWQTEQQELAASGEIARYLRIIRENIARSKQITQSLLNFSRKSEWREEWIDVAAVLEESLALFKHSYAQKGVNLSKDWPDDLPKVTGDSLQLMQVLVNLLNNSLDAVPFGGSITVQAHRDNDQLVIRVADNGAGIEEKDMPKVFDPFFTTKEIGKGTGLGLSICYGIISRMGGAICLESRKGVGTEVTITLPVLKGGSV